MKQSGKERNRSSQRQKRVVSNSRRMDRGYLGGFQRLCGRTKPRPRVAACDENPPSLGHVRVADSDPGRQNRHHRDGHPSSHCGPDAHSARGGPVASRGGDGGQRGSARNPATARGFDAPSRRLSDSVCSWPGGGSPRSLASDGAGVGCGSARRPCDRADRPCRGHRRRGTAALNSMAGRRSRRAPSRRGDAPRPRGIGLRHSGRRRSGIRGNAVRMAGGDGFLGPDLRECRGRAVREVSAPITRCVRRARRQRPGRQRRW